MRNKPLFSAAMSLVAFASAFLGACAGLPREGWAVDGKALPKGAAIGLSLAEGDVTEAVLTSPYLGEGVEVRGEVVPPLSSSSYLIELTELRYFGNWRKGWTEATFALTGSLRLRIEDGQWRCALEEAPVVGSATSAKLRYADDFLYGDRALEAVRHRTERINAAVAVLRGNGATWFDMAEKPEGLFKRERGLSLTEAVGPVLFPEVYGYPSGTWKEGPWLKGDGRKWDTGYTKSRFPEHLREVRDSGTLYRDWEEALPLWYLAVQWAPFWEERFPAGEFSLLHTNGDEK